MDNTEPHDSCNETSTPCTCFPTDEMVPVINVLGAAKKKTHLVTFENEWKPRNLMVRHAWDDVPLFFSGSFIFQVVEFSGSFLGGVKIAKITNVFARTSVSPFCAFTKSCLWFKLLELQLSHFTYQKKIHKNASDRESYDHHHLVVSSFSFYTPLNGSRIPGSPTFARLGLFCCWRGCWWVGRITWKTHVLTPKALGHQNVSCSIQLLCQP